MCLSSIFSQVSECLVDLDVRGGGDVRDIRTLIFNDLGDECLEEFTVIILVLLAVPPPLAYALHDLVVARPQHQTRIVSDTTDLLLHLLLYVQQELLARRVNAVAEHKVVENHQTQARSALVEGIRLILTSSPNSQHVEVRIYSILQQHIDLVKGVEVFRVCVELWVS